MTLTNSEREFLSACETGRLEEVKRFVAAGINVHCKDESNEFTGIHWAAKKNHLPILRYLCENTDADVNELQITGMGAIHMASFNGATDILKYLVEKGGADINQPKGGTGSTPVFLCSQTGKLETLRYLVRAGADVNIPTIKGATPLGVAAEYAELECVKCLVKEGGANLEISNGEGFTPLMKCCGVFGAKPPTYKKTAVAKFLIEEAGANVSAKEKNLRSTLHLAARSGYIDTLKSLIAHGGDVNNRDSGDFVPLCDAASNGKVESIRLLLSEGADPTAKGWNGNTFLHLAANLENEKTVDFILNNTERSILPVDVKNFYGYTPLHLAAKAGNEAVIQRLLIAGANINERTCLGETALHVAIENGRSGIIELLLSSGADPVAQNLQGQSCYTLANVVGMGHLFKDSKLNAIKEEQLMTSAEFFVQEAKGKVSEAIDLKHVLLLEKDTLLQAGCMPHYSECERQGWHVPASRIKQGEKVLFVSHRWGSIEFPDPTLEQYNIVEQYLRGVVKDIDYIWLDYACICQDKQSELFGCHLGNIPTAIICATHMLIVPKLTNVPHTSNPNEFTSVGNLTDYLDRAWCLFESMAGLLTSTIIHLSFQLGKEEITFKLFGQPQSASASLGFYRSKVGEWNRWLRQRPHAWVATHTAELSKILSFTEPCRILAVLMRISRSKDTDFKEIAEKVKTMQVSREEMLSSKYPLLQELWDLLGNCFCEDDKVVVANLTLFMGFYTMRTSSETQYSAISNNKEPANFELEKTKVTSSETQDSEISHHKEPVAPGNVDVETINAPTIGDKTDNAPTNSAPTSAVSCCMIS